VASGSADPWQPEPRTHDTVLVPAPNSAAMSGTIDSTTELLMPLIKLPEPA